MRVLIADGDARFLRDLAPWDHFSYHEIVGNLADAMKLIDRRKKWDAAIFDRYLSDDGLPFERGKLVHNAGFLLAVAFHDKFPGMRSAIVTGAPGFRPADVPENIAKLEHPHLCQYLSKENMFVDSFGKTSEGMWQMIRFLRGEWGEVYRYNQDLLDCLLLEPNFCGLGINLRNVIDRIWRHFSE
ncbi:hypothetical protein KA005_25715 [bacterium]|nr:hypothetical protein [bacterium]